MNDRSWVFPVAVVMVLVVTAVSWFRWRRLRALRPWLIRHVIGNLVLALGLFAAWRYDLGLFYYAAIVVGVFVMWKWGTPKLRDAAQAMPSKGISESTLSPFQSAEVREICAHLSPTEHARLIKDARERGQQIGRWFAVPLAFVSAFLFWSWRLGLALVALFVVYFVLWILPRFRAMRHRTVELLCATEWARTHNYTPTRLRLMTFPWSK